jgi:flavin reductase (DIM6/NTAB) family NADH-FMN oxidoreductase RutF
MMPMGYWTVISKNPFRLLLAMGVGNYSLTLLRKYKEAALHFMPWSERQRVIRAGYLSGRDGSKAEKLGFTLLPAAKLKQTRLVQGADNIFELTTFLELGSLSTEFAIFAMNVVHVHGQQAPLERQPILFMGQEDFATVGPPWHFEK